MKYKVWHIERKEWIHDPWDLYIDPDGDVWEIEECGSYDRYMSKTYMTDKVKVARYTGLEDRNGVEIYESDILRIYVAAFDEDHPETEDIQEVEFKQGCFEVDNTPLYVFDDQSDMFQCEVIGNIYASPDLLPKAIVATE